MAESGPSSLRPLRLSAAPVSQSEAGAYRSWRWQRIQKGGIAVMPARMIALFCWPLQPRFWFVCVPRMDGFKPDGKKPKAVEVTHENEMMLRDMGSHEAQEGTWDMTCDM